MGANGIIEKCKGKSCPHFKYHPIIFGRPEAVCKHPDIKRTIGHDYIILDGLSVKKFERIKKYLHNTLNYHIKPPK